MANSTRDTAAVNALLQRGWRVLTVWECAIRRATQDHLAYETLAAEASSFLTSSVPQLQIPAYFTADARRVAHG